MDITVKIRKREDNSSRSYTFIGNKDAILPDIQDLIRKNKTEFIEVVSEDGDMNLTTQELFQDKEIEDKWWEKIPHGPSMGE
jgi:hypothetical protein